MAASRFPVGSSAKSTRGRLAKARAIATRCCSPPDNWAGKWSARAASPTRSSRTRPREAASEIAAQLERDRDVLERGQRRDELKALEHEAYLFSAELCPRIFGERAEVDAVDQDRAPRRGVESCEQAEQRRFAASGGADDRDICALRDLERHRVECPEDGIATPVFFGQFASDKHDRGSGSEAMEVQPRCAMTARSNARLCLRGVAGAAVLCLTVAAAGCTATPRPPAATPQSTSQESGALSRRADSTASAGRGTVLIVGTSLTAGLGLDPDQAYPALLQRKVDSAGLPYRLVNAGLSGETSAGALRRVSWLLRQPVAVFVLETGANDGLRGLDVDSTKAHIAAILDSVRRADPQAAICLVQMEAPPNLGPHYTRAFHDVYPAVARSQGATLLPFLLRGVAGDLGSTRRTGCTRT